MKEEELRLLGSLVDWQEADKAMKITFRKCFRTVLQQKFSELEEAKKNLKAFVEENFREKLQRTPTRFNPTMKLREQIRRMKLDEHENSELSEDYSPNILCKNKIIPSSFDSRDVPTSVHFEQIDSDEMQPKTPLMSILKKPSGSESGHCENPNTSIFLCTVGMCSAKEQNTITSKTPLHQMRETPTSSGSLCGRSLRGIGLFSQQRDLMEREKIASRNREVFLSNRVEHTRSLRERGFMRVRRNKNCSPDNATPVSLLKPLCSVPAVSALRWDLSPSRNAIDRMHDVKTVQRYSPKINMFNDDDFNNNSSQNISAADFEEATVNELDEAILNVSEDVVDQPNDPGSTFIVTPVKTSLIARIPASIVKDTTFCNAKGIDSCVNAQRMHVAYEQIERHFGKIKVPVFREIFDGCDTAKSASPDRSSFNTDELTSHLS